MNFENSRSTFRILEQELSCQWRQNTCVHLYSNVYSSCEDVKVKVLLIRGEVHYP
jgi:hypothetical protein